MGGRSSIDDLARSLAEPMPRRRALRLIGAAVGATAFGGLLPRRAAAQECLPGYTACCRGTCCAPGEDCVCGPLHICRRPPDPCPAGTTTCQGVDKYVQSCCNEGFECQNHVCVPKCPSGTSKCGSTCCGRGQECRDGRCVKVCPDKRAPCGAGKCCPRGQYCTDARRGTCERCPRGQKSCGKKCCPKGQKCCDAQRGLCCPESGTCCPPRGRGQRTICCPKGRPCVYGDTSLTCCPASRSAPQTYEGANRCCPAGQVAVSDPRASGMKKCCPTGESAFAARGDVVCCSADRFAPQTFEGADVCCPAGTRAVDDPRGPGLKQCR